MQGHAGRRLQAFAEEGLGRVQAVVVGKTHDDARRLEAFGGHALQAPRSHHRAHLAAQIELLVAQAREAVGARFQHHVAGARQGVGGQGGVVGMAAAFVGLHDLQPLLQVHREAAVRRAVDGGSCALAQHHESAAGRTAPALLWRAHQHIDPRGLHVHPDRARGDAVEHEEAADFVRGLGHRAQIVVGQDHAGGGFDMRRADHGGALLADRGHHLGDRRRRIGHLAPRRNGPRFEHGVCGRNLAHIEDLRPAVAEPAIANHQGGFAGGELASHRLHAEAAAAGHNDRRARAIDLLQHARDIAHHLLEFARHVVERAVGIDDRIFEQAVGIGFGQEAGHGVLLRVARWLRPA